MTSPASASSTSSATSASTRCRGRAAGASVVGLDFSPPAIEAATSLASETGLDARFVVRERLRRSSRRWAASGSTIVYTGLGALNWLPDLARWAEIVAELLEPDGFLYLTEFHPFTWVFADETLEIEHDYFHNPEGESFDDGEQGSYADMTAPTRNNATREWAHTISDVVTALLDAGLRLELLHEHDYTLFPRFEHLSSTTRRSAPASSTASLRRPRLPLMYSSARDASRAGRTRAIRPYPHGVASLEPRQTPALPPHTDLPVTRAFAESGSHGCGTPRDVVRRLRGRGYEPESTRR